MITIKKKGIFMRNEKIDFLKEIELDSDIVFSGFEYKYKNILLTGATGFLGSHLLYELLEKTDTYIYCFVRAETDESALRRIKARLKYYSLWKDIFNERIQAFAGDLAKSRFGLRDDTYFMLSEKINMVYHCGCESSFIKNYQSLKKTNVLGTIELIKFSALNKTKIFHYISTLGVFSFTHYLSGENKKEFIDENQSLDDSLKTLDYDLGYIQSKWVAEKIVSSAIEKGLPGAIYRPSFILSHSQSGALKTFDAFAILFRKALDMGYCLEPTGHHFPFTTVDYTSQAIAHISIKSTCLRKIFHLCDEYNTPLNKLLEMLSASLHYPLNKISASQFTSFLTKHAVTSEKINFLTPIFTKKVYNGLTLIEVYKNFLPFKSENTKKALLDSNIRPYPINEDVLKRYLEFLQTKGTF